MVGIGTAGKDTVTGFTTGFDSGESDKLYFTSVSGNMAVKTSGKEVQITNGSAAMKLENLKLTNGTAELIVNERKLAAAGSGSTIQASGTGYADYYYGTKAGGVGSGLSFQSTDDDVNIDLRDTEHYRNITTLVSGTGNGTLIGGTGSETLVAAGTTSLWGGAGSASDTLKSSAGSTTMFYWGIGEGNDLIVSEGTTDVVNLYDVTLADLNLSNTNITDGGVTLSLNDGSTLTVQTKRNMTFVMDGMRWTADLSSKNWYVRK